MRKDNQWWTDAAQVLLFELVKHHFGARSEWPKWPKCKPGRGLDAQYDAFCATFAALIGTTPKGVSMRVDFALDPNCPKNEKIRLTHHMAMSAAYRAGFLKASDLTIEEPEALT